MNLSSFMIPALWLLLQIRLINCTAPGNASSPTPISLQPSNYWDGNDGAWSTFAFQIGTPPQAIRLLPSITGNAIWAVWSYACELSNLVDCPGARGNVFNISASTTWQTEGNYSLPLNPQHYLPYSGGGVLGFDNITLGWPGYGARSLNDQVTFAYLTEDFPVGSIGLRPDPTNISTFNDPIPSIVGSLRQEGLIPSTSWGYLAGASYYSYPILGYGSLTLGGFDASRFNANANLTLAGSSDPFRPFLLGIESITTTDNREMLTEPIITALDSLTTQIWLPISACQAFEAAFDLVWNETYQLYLLSEDQHSALVARNASVIFTLSTGIPHSTERLIITLPYGAFDLKASPPLAGNDTYFYFPLKRAANETQYTLGRVILQEIYILAAYDWKSITLYEAVYPESSVDPNIIAICPPNSTTCLDISTVKQHKLPVGAIAGIVIAAVLILIAICVAVWFKCFRKPKPEQSLPEDIGGSRRTSISMTPYPAGLSDKPELDGTSLASPRSEPEEYYKPGGRNSVRDSGYTSVSPRRAASSSAGFSPSMERGWDEAVESEATEVYESGGRGFLELHGEPRTSPSPPELAGSSTRHEMLGSTAWPKR